MLFSAPLPGLFLHMATAFMSCHTLQQIADVVGLSRQSVTDIISEIAEIGHISVFGKFGNFEDNSSNLLNGIGFLDF